MRLKVNFKIIVAVATSLIITGCASFNKPKVVYEPEIIYINHCKDYPLPDAPDIVEFPQYAPFVYEDVDTVYAMMSIKEYEKLALAASKTVTFTNQLVDLLILCRSDNPIELQSEESVVSE